MALEKLKMRVNVGQRQLVVNCADYTYERAVELADKVAEVRRKNSLFSKYPMEEGETREKWRERIEPLLENDIVRKDGESETEHLGRLFESRVDSHDAAFDIVNAIATSFGNAPFSKEDFKKTNWIDIRGFIYDVLNLGDIPCDDFYPKRLSR